MFHRCLKSSPVGDADDFFFFSFFVYVFFVRADVQKRVHGTRVDASTPRVIRRSRPTSSGRVLFGMSFE